MHRKSWINCELAINRIDSFDWNKWKKKLVLERLERKATEISQRLEETKMIGNKFFFFFFELLAKNFGLHTNGTAFLKMAQQLTFQLIRKEKTNLIHVEALFFGILNALQFEYEDAYYNELKKRGSI